MAGSERLYTKKVFYQILGKRLKTRRRQFRVLCRLDFLKKKKVFKKMSMLETCSRNVAREFMIAKLHHGSFPRNVATVVAIFICLVSQIIMGLIGLCQGNCLGVI